MLQEIRGNWRLQLPIGFVIGGFFGFFLYISGVTRYDVIIGQLLLKDFTVLKVMLTAVVVGMIGIYMMKAVGKVKLHPKSGSIGSTAIGGIIFGIGFALLGYCPGTAAGATGQGSLDALFGGIVGMIIGAGLFASLYPQLNEKILGKGKFSYLTIPEMLKTNPWLVVIPVALLIAGFLAWLEYLGL